MTSMFSNRKWVCLHNPFFIDCTHLSWFYVSIQHQVGQYLALFCLQIPQEHHFQRHVLYLSPQCYQHTNILHLIKYTQWNWANHRPRWPASWFFQEGNVCYRGTQACWLPTWMTEYFVLSNTPEKAKVLWFPRTTRSFCTRRSRIL